MSAQEIAFVTGAAQGIGLATARRLAQDGFRVVAMDRSAEVLGAAVAALRCEGLDVVAAVVDVCDRASVVAALATEARVDVMVCAAGIYNDAKFLDLDEDAFRRMLDVNVIGTFIPAQEAARRMVAGGRIVTISSVAAIIGNRGQVNYAAAKGALHSATKSLSLELASRGITVNAVAPGIIATSVSAASFDEQAIHRLVPMKRVGRPEEVADLVGFLCSNQAAYITGQIISINGGMI